MSMLAPLDNIRPSDILEQHSEWVYFALALTFFISIAGLTLRKHFERPYVKPLIIVLGLMMTVGVFMMRDAAAMIFEGLGVLGTLILAFVAATIPYGLCRGFGMSANRALSVAYVLFYILSWLKFPNVYYYLADNNMGLLNLGSLILFFAAVYKIVNIKKSLTDFAGPLKTTSPFPREIRQEMDIQDQESRVIEREETTATTFEIKTIKGIEESLIEMIKIIEADTANLTIPDRARIADALKKISSEEDVFLKTIRNLKGLLHRLRRLDEKEFQEVKNRFARSAGVEKQILEKELFAEEEKLKAEHDIMALDQKLVQGMQYFNGYVQQAIHALNTSAYPADAIQHLAQALRVLKNIMELIDTMKSFENKLFRLSQEEKNLLKKERKEA